ncbi:hypothetical protein BDW22DRAFT_1229084 [Trametopsis cervina]|nr:hypothetical protein BDW22DRAFT_1229084 [Trametopsis cervina]
MLEWEGPEAVEEFGNGHIDPILLTNRPEGPKRYVDVEEPEESSDDGSEDEYVVEESKRKAKRRAYAPSSDSASEADTGTRVRVITKGRQVRRPSAISISTKQRSVSGSPGPSSPALKRRKSTASHEQSAKRKRSESLATPGAGADAARKYCSTKLQEIFVDIFLKYPILHEANEDDDEIVIDKKKDDLTTDEAQMLEEKARRFATELEEYVFQTHAEPDPKTGHPMVGMKYKERFRMLTFNLSKADRVMLHKRIAASHITPRELSTMSSTDLANEETKESIRQAEQEALAHSILKKATLPTAKMTHKGMMDIEDMSGGLTRERERERERDEEERIEMERLERLKLQTQKAQAHQGPESPTTPSWGAPPPVPAHAMHAGDPGSSSGRPSLNSLFIHTASDMVSSPIEQELNLADLINIDEEPGQELSISLVEQPIVPPLSQSTPTAPESDGAVHSSSASQSPPPSATGLSPFATRLSNIDITPRSFDLNAIWSSKEGDVSAGPRPDSENTSAGDTSEPSLEQRPQSPINVDDNGGGADDQDFDMFLQGGDEEMEVSPPEEKTPESIEAAFNASAHVWTGKISMPLDSTIAQEVPVHARQIGGRTLGDDSLLWRTLFPSDHLRIDGRVPVDKSAEYLTQMRLNPSKELIAVAYAPEPGSSTDNFMALSKYLLDKNRHGLIFPWGNRPKEHHPGRELYVVPLRASEPLPEFLELLDEMKLPRNRHTDLMIGIWVLNKGKLAPPPMPIVPSAPPPSAIAAPIPPPSTSTPPTLPPSILPPALAALPASLIPPMGQLPPNVSAEALAAEVASLTPEQIQLMLHTLAANSGQPVPPMGLPPPAAPLPVGQPQPWMPVAPPPYPAYGPPPVPSASPYRPPPPPDRFDHDRPPYPYQSDHHYESYDRGDRGGDRGHRGRGSNWNRDRGSDRPRDTGWRGRGRGRGSQGTRDRGKQWAGSPGQQW